MALSRADAADAGSGLSEAGFRRFAHDLLSERAGHLPAGKPLRAEWVAIRLSAPMLIVSVAAARLRVPFGTAFHLLLADVMLLERAGAVRPARGALRALLGSLAPPPSRSRWSRRMMHGRGAAQQPCPATT